MATLLHKPAALAAGLLLALPAGAVSLGETALRGTIVVSDPARSMALFELPGGDLRTLRVGAELPGVGRLTGIGPRGVHFRANGTDVEFTFNDSALATGGTSRRLAVVTPGIETGSARDVELRVDKPRSYVMPDLGQRRRYQNAEEEAQDATPRPGETIDETVWDAPPRQRRQQSR